VKLRPALVWAPVALALAPLACGGGGDGGAAGRSTKLVWDEQPRVVVPETLPRDRILRGRVRNEGLDKLTIEASEVRLLDEEGRRVDGVATFILSYVKPRFPYNRGPGSGPGRYPEEERRRLGLVGVLEPGQSLPFTVSWHEPPGRRTVAEIDYGPGSLEVPPRLRG
jgi:hypothetical protein